MKLIKDKFKYPDLKRVENELGRFYIDSRGQEVPSVTNVLSSTSDQSGIDEWKRRVGHEEAERILQDCFQRNLAIFYLRQQIFQMLVEISRHLLGIS